MNHPELSSISKILDNMYLSGIKPFNNPKNLKGIKYVLSCVDLRYVLPKHYLIDTVDNDVTFFYLPYNDNVYQNLWDYHTSYPTIRKTKSNEYDTKAKQWLENKWASQPMIEVSYHIIDNVLESGQPILIHCMAGVSRSVSMIIYYLMRKYGMGFDDAYHLIKSRRSIINPNKSFQAQLRKYDKHRSSTKIDMDNIIENVISQ